MRNRWVAFVLILAGCGASTLTAPEVERPSVVGQKCGIEKREAAPLIVDWTSGERGRLEARLREGVLLVKVSDCSIQPLWHCTSNLAYRYAGSTRRTESERISDAKSLYAKLPTTAVSLEGKLSAEAEIRVTKTTVGRYSSERLGLAESDFSGRCEGATHFVSAVAVGAFRLAVAQRAAAGGKAEMAGMGAGAETAKERELLSADGEVLSCTKATEALTAPPSGCGAPIQVDLAPLARTLGEDEFRELLAKGSLAVNEACRRHKVFGGGSPGIWVVVEPSGRVVPRWDDHPGHFFGTPAYNCTLETWEKLSVEPFSGPPVYAHALFFIDESPPRDCNGDPGCSDRRVHVKSYYRTYKPLPILTKEDAEKVKYQGPIPEAPSE